MENEFEPEVNRDELPGEEAKTGLKPSQIAVLVVGIVLLVGILAALVVLCVENANLRSQVQNPTTPTVTTPGATDPQQTQPGGTTPEATVPTDGNPDDETCKGSYTASDEDVTAAHDTVVATLGDARLTNGMLQIYYWRWFYDFLEENGMYVYYYGLDYTAPLDTQLLPDGSETWQQYCLLNAITTWRQYQSLCMAAQEAGFTMDQDLEDYLLTLPQELDQVAAENGFADGSAMLLADFGPGCTLEDYVEYMRTYYLGYSYFGSKYDELTFTESEIETYFDAHAAELGVEKNGEACVDVRHILLEPAGTTDEDWEACYASAQDLLNQWLAGEATEETFAQLANEHSQDPGSNTTGGLYTGVTPDASFVEEFKAWCMEEGRKTGDYGIVRTTYGYHIMYLSNTEPLWHYKARSALINEGVQKFTESLIEKYELKVDYPSILLGNISMS